MQDRLSIVASKQYELVPVPCLDPPDRAVCCAESGAAASHRASDGSIRETVFKDFHKPFYFYSHGPNIGIP